MAPQELRIEQARDEKPRGPLKVGRAPTSTSSRSGAAEGEPEGHRRVELSRRDTALRVTMRPTRSDCAGGGGKRQEAVCARLGGYLFVSYICYICFVCSVEVRRTLAISRLVGRGRARLRGRRDAEERKRDYRADDDVHGSP